MNTATPATEDPVPASVPTDPGLETITLETPIRRGDQVIRQIALRKPIAREMRGLQVGPLVQGDVNAVMALIPRISMPTLVAQEVEELSIEDFGVISGVVLGFFMSKADRDMIARVMGQDQTSTS
jgi:hypothetical protein